MHQSIWVRMFATFAMTGFLWIPVVFAAFAIGRRQISLKSIFVFLTIESLALAAYVWFVSEMR